MSISVITLSGVSKIVDSVNYLETNVPKKNNTLLTKVYFKLSDIHQMMHKHSFHTKHTFKGLLKSQIMRFCLICSNEKDVDQALGILFQALCKINYSKGWMCGIKSKTVR